MDDAMIKGRSPKEAKAILAAEQERLSDLLKAWDYLSVDDQLNLVELAKQLARDAEEGYP